MTRNEPNLNSATADFAKEQELLQVKLLRDYSRDGLFETLFGWMHVWAAALLLSNLRAAIGPHYANLILDTLFIMGIILLGRLLGRAWLMRITYPRLGFASFTTFWQWSQGRKRLWVKILQSVVILTLFDFLLGMLVPERSKGPWDLLPAESIFRMSIAFMLTFGIVWLRLKHLWIIAAALTGLLVLAHFQHLDPSWAIGIVGLILLAIGLVKLRRFLRDYPLLEADDAS